MDYTQHYQKRQTPQSELAHEKQAPNNAGGFSFVLDDWKRLERFLVLGAEGGTYYVGERKLSRDNAKCVERCLSADGKRTVDTIVAISDAGRAPKNDPAIFALALAAAAKDEATRKAALMALPLVCRTGTHLFQFVQAVKGMRGFGRGLRSALSHWYRDKDPSALAYQVLKYQNRAGWNHRDVLRLCHAEPRAPGGSDDKHAALFRWIARAEMGQREVQRGVVKLSTNGATMSSKSYPAVTGLPSLIDAYAQLLAADSAAKVEALIREHGFTHEMVPTAWKNDLGVWSALLDKMPVTAMIRNLGKMTELGLCKPLSAAAGVIVERLGDAERMKKARVHPIGLLSALRVYGSGHGVRGKLSWSPVSQVVDALDGAFYASFDHIEPTGKRMLLALDVSGSMGSPDLAGVPGITPRDGSVAMAMVTARNEKNYAVVAFTSGGFGRGPSMHPGYAAGISPIDVSPRQRLDDIVQKTSALTFGGTDCSLPMLYAAAENLKIDAFVTYTDSETWAGNVHPHQALEQYRQKTGINATLVVVGMNATEFTIANPDDAGELDVVGFDTATPSVLADFVRN